MKPGEKLLIAVSCVAVVGFGLAGLRAYVQDRNVRAELEAAKGYKFPVAELASLDRDVQARFAVVPTKDFGLERVGPVHGLYQPHTWAEKQTVAALKAEDYEVAFFVLSRRTYEDERGQEGYYPIQGPVLVTSPRAGEPPRWKPFFDSETRIRDGVPIRSSRQPLELMNSKGTPVPTTVAEAEYPREAELLKLGFDVFRLSDQVPAPGFVGGGTVLPGGWQISATPIRASHKACVECHRYNDWDREKYKSKLGDAFGVAMYAYRKLPANSN